MLQNTSQVSQVREPNTSSTSLQLSESRDVIEDFVIDFCGLMKVKDPNGSVRLVRITRPKITYDFAKDLITNIYVEINRITGRTTWTTEEIRLYCLHRTVAQAEWFSAVGINNMVSEKAWQRCLEWAKPDQNATGRVLEDGTLQYPNTWEFRYGIQWHYNMPFNVDMLNIIKEDDDLIKNESFSQDIILKDIFWACRVFIHGGMNRSQDHLTLKHEAVIHKETYSQSAETMNQTMQKEGVIDKFKQMIRGIAGS